jgi:hypothetical protein
MVYGSSIENSTCKITATWNWVLQMPLCKGIIQNVHSITKCVSSSLNTNAKYVKTKPFYQIIFY